MELSMAGVPPAFFSLPTALSVQLELSCRSQESWDIYKLCLFIYLAMKQAMVHVTPKKVGKIPLAYLTVLFYVFLASCVNVIE